VRGIGRWTAEMFLIFNLLRSDVWPLDDVGLLRAIGIHWSEDPEAALKDRRFKASRQEAAALGERLRPWRSVATWYLWRSLDPEPVSY
ncbi:MAG: DNA-3-methyladenine glycosylase 2 family protein, partial [Betaproteobacteria bacterium]|nr:DNA-3-methyladenine glycosylase 2 family protein [Betaproteobacteria bacterium]